MGAGFDLQVDTDRLRICADRVSGAAHDLLAAGRASGDAADRPIGSTPTAVEVGALLSVKTDQAAGAAAALGAISAAVAAHLTAAAAHFERVDAALRPVHR